MCVALAMIEMRFTYHYHTYSMLYDSQPRQENEENKKQQISTVRAVRLLQ